MEMRENARHDDELHAFSHAPVSRDHTLISGDNAIVFEATPLVSEETPRIRKPRPFTRARPLTSGHYRLSRQNKKGDSDKLLMRLALSLVFLQFCFLLLNLLFLLQGGRHAFLCLLPRLRLNADFVFLDPLVVSIEKEGIIKCKILTKS